MIQHRPRARRFALRQREDTGTKGGCEINSGHLLRAAPLQLYFSKLPVYLAREIARNRPAEENIYCAVLSSHGKSEQRRERKFFTPPDVPSPMEFLSFSTSFSISPSLFFSRFLFIPSLFCRISRDTCHPLSTLRRDSGRRRRLLYGSTRTPGPEDYVSGGFAVRLSFGDRTVAA